MASRGRQTTLVVVCVVPPILLVVGVGAWSEIATAHHLWKLRTVPRYLEQLVDAPEESPRGVAMRRFAEDPSGARILLATIQRELALHEEHFVTVMGRAPRFFDGSPPPRLLERSLRSLDEYWFSYDPETVSRTWAFSMDSMPFPDDTRTASRIMRWLRFADGTELASSDERPRTFRVRAERTQNTEGLRVEIVVRGLAGAGATE